VQSTLHFTHQLPRLQSFFSVVGATQAPYVWPRVSVKHRSSRYVKPLSLGCSYRGATAEMSVRRISGPIRHPTSRISKRPGVPRAFRKLAFSPALWAWLAKTRLLSPFWRGRFDVGSTSFLGGEFLGSTPNFQGRVALFGWCSSLPAPLVRLVACLEEESALGHSELTLSFS
jgi:hypothetical protein